MQRAVENDDPTRPHRQRRRAQPGFFFKLAPNAGFEIEPTVAIIAGIGRAGGKIDSPRIGRVCAHLAEYIAAVGAHQRRRTETVGDGRVRKTEIAPGEKILEIGLEMVRAHDGFIAASLNLPGAGQKHPSIVQFRLARQNLRPMRINLGGAFVRKRPIVFNDPALQPVSENHRACANAHTVSIPLATITAAPPTLTPASAPLRTVIVSAISLRRPISTPCSIMI